MILPINNRTATRCLFKIHYYHPFYLLQIFTFSIQSKYGCKDQESIQTSTTPDPGYQWESDKFTVDTTNASQEVSMFSLISSDANDPQGLSKGAKIRNRYNQVPHLTQDTNGKVTNSQ